jgi:two-component system, OmpR family, alkaline phosphatase synthesis response regulator PhoP
MPKRILVADDEAHIARIVQMNLQRRGYDVTTASDGRQAMDSVAESAPDLILLDVMMPHMDGFEVLTQLKADPATRDIPVIMLTARAHDRDIFEGGERGAEVYLTKPVNPGELISHVDRILGTASE